MHAVGIHVCVLHVNVYIYNICVCLCLGGGEEGFHYWPSVTGSLGVGLCCFGCECVSLCEYVLDTLCCFGCECVTV